ncbi:VWA domain-containing protein [Gemmata sp. JC673]|uniref:VWA domain-containing protein n=1 Tax=Gemmata algarum TaxID=2975278 RepID=A0ABU5EXM4_9BACT|nr:VWA domain-containing protein [Gemmata algarum]MDY3560004.1 VWA domain-containing protein [Gemmata algarum]
MIRPTVRHARSRYERFLKAFGPAWVVSSVAHALVFGALFWIFGPTRTTVATPPKAVINTGLPTTDELDLGDVTELNLGDPQTDSRAARTPTAVADPGAGDWTPLAAGRAEDPFAVPLNKGDLLAGLGDLSGRDDGRFPLGFAGAGSASFFGTAARGNRFAILADNSGSMAGTPLTVLKAEITSTLARSRGNAQFYVTFFSGEADPQPIKRWTADRNEVAAVSKWVQGIQTANGTSPVVGFQHVLKLKPPPDVVYLMTDGEFDRREVEQIRVLNQALRPPAVIHTVAFGGQQGEAELKMIARQAKGTYRYVAGPKP